MSKKRLYKSTSDQKVSGVLAGIADYFGVDSTVLRLGFIVVTVATVVVPCVIGYILAAWIMPRDTEV